VPYRLDVPGGSTRFEQLVDLGALDAELAEDGNVAALMPDSVHPDQVARALRIDRLCISPAIGRDTESVWVLNPRPILAGRIRIVPVDSDAKPGDLRLLDTPAFGTGLHPTTALCLEWLSEALEHHPADTVLDVGTGSGVLALAALTLGVRRGHGLDIDGEALRVAAENARLNGLEERFYLTLGGPDVVDGTWPLVFANVLAAPLIEMAPILVRRLGHDGRLVLSGIPASVAEEVERAYCRFGLRRVRLLTRTGWVALALQASW
jgi:ribosomal protein L11 methyltransferase